MKSSKRNQFDLRFLLSIILIGFTILMGVYCTPQYAQPPDLSGIIESSITPKNIDDEYMYKLRNRVLEDAVKMDFNLQSSENTNKWDCIPNKFTGGDSLRHMINPGNPAQRILTKKSYVKNLHYNLVWYSKEATSTLNTVWRNKNKKAPNIKGAISYPKGTLIAQFEMVQDKIPDAFSWNILVDTFGNTGPNPLAKPPVSYSTFEAKKREVEVYMKRISLAYKDSTLGWVYMAYLYDDVKGQPSKKEYNCTNCKGQYAGLNKLLPVGASRKTKSPITIKTIYSSVINQNLQKPFKGLNNHLTSPGDNSLPCVYCHSAAQWNINNEKLNNPGSLVTYFSKKIFSKIKKKDLEQLYPLNTSEVGFCDNSKGENANLKKTITNICKDLDPGPGWVSLDNDLFLTVTAASYLQRPPKKKGH